jgi:hypothetical protein
VSIAAGFLTDGRPALVFMQSMIQTLLLDQHSGGHIIGENGSYIPKQAHAVEIPKGRNEIVAAMLDKSKAEWLWMVDSDMGFAPPTPYELVASAESAGAKVMGALCFAHKSDGTSDLGARRYRPCPTLYRFAVDDETGFSGLLPMFDYPRDEVVEVDATGMACVVIHRSVLEQIRAKWGDVWFSQIPKPENNDALFGEDVSFCLRCGLLDVPLFVDTAVKTTHDKGGVFWDEESYDLWRAARGDA